MQVTSAIIASADGKKLLSETVKVNSLGGVNRTEMFANNQFVGYQEKPVSSDVECTILHTKDTDLLQLQNLKSCTLTLETDTGVSYTINDASCAAPLGLDDGKSVLRFIGPPAKAS